MNVHLEGMGITGSLIAYQLEALGLRWSWHDTEELHNAWQASTGAIFPAGAGQHIDKQTWLAWAGWLNKGSHVYPIKHFEPANYWFCTKQPPHHGDYQHWQEGKHGLRHAGQLSYHLNAQTFVPATRKKFHGRRLDLAPASYGAPDDLYVVAHGFGQRLHHTLWGWTTPVRLSYPAYMADSFRPAFYFREGRFIMCYAYPRPGTDDWYAGSSLIRQSDPHCLEVEPKYDRWKENFERLSGGAVKVTKHGEWLQGWRPAEGDGRWAPLVKRKGKVLTVPPLWHSGIRHFPEVWRQLEKELKRGARP